MASRYSFASLTAVAVVLAGCVATSNEWSGWGPASATGRIVPFDPESTGAEYEQATIAHNGATRERWWWRTGGLYIEKAGFGKFIRANFNAYDVVEVSMAFDTLRAMKLEIDDGAIEQGRNRLGAFYYTVSNRTIEDLTCFVFVQPFPVEAIANAYTRGPASDGVIAGYDCREVKPGNADVFAAEMLDFLGS